MKVVAILVIALAALAVADEMSIQWGEWKTEHGKVYASAEEDTTRFKIFSSNVAMINEHNADPTQTFTMATNKWADLSPEEWRSIYTSTPMPKRRSNATSIHYAPDDLSSVPQSVNWVTAGAVTPVKDQGQCGDCWAFSTCASTEGAWFLAGNQLVSLSAQELTDCDTTDDGCNGGLMDDGFDWIQKNGGICSWTAYPFVGKQTRCSESQCQNVASISGHTDVQQSEQALMSAVAQQPVSIAVDASNWQFYSGGIYTQKCGKQLDHGVLAAGYGTSNGQDYWLVKNSWGTSWGEQGYIRVGRGNDECGIQNMASYPTAS